MNAIDQVTDLPLFAPASWLADLAPKVQAFWATWRLSGEGRIAINAAVSIALERRRAGATRLFIDELAWEVRQRTRQSLNNTARSCLSRYLMATYPELRGCFEIRGARKVRAASGA